MPFIKKLAAGVVTLNVPGIDAFICENDIVEVSAGQMRLYNKPFARAIMAGLIAIVAGTEEVAAISANVLEEDSESAGVLGTSRTQEEEEKSKTPKATIVEVPASQALRKEEGESKTPATVTRRAERGAK